MFFQNFSRDDSIRGAASKLSHCGRQVNGSDGSREDVFWGVTGFVDEKTGGVFNGLNGSPDKGIIPAQNWIGLSTG